MVGKADISFLLPLISRETVAAEIINRPLANSPAEYLEHRPLPTSQSFSHYSLIPIASPINFLESDTNPVSTHKQRSRTLRDTCEQAEARPIFLQGRLRLGYYEMPELDHTMVRSAQSDKNGMPSEVGAINGGMIKRKCYSGPIVTIQVEDIDAALQAVVKNTLIGEEFGFSAFEDPEGNLMDLYQLPGS